MPNFEQFDPVIEGVRSKTNALWLRLVLMEVSEVISPESTALEDVIEFENRLDQKLRQIDNAMEKEAKSVSIEEYEKQWEQKHWSRTKEINTIMGKLNAIHNVCYFLKNVRAEAIEEEHYKRFEERDSSDLDESFTPIRLARLGPNA